MRSLRGVSILSVLVVAAALALAKTNAIPDRDLSLSKTSVFEVPEPPPELANGTDPGDRPSVETDFPEQPPIVPHGSKDWLPITLEENQCVDCHAVDEKIEGEPTPIPKSHYVDLRNAPTVTQENVVGARYYCVACHAVPGDSDPLVENLFGK